MMGLSEPQVRVRAEQRYVAIGTVATMDSIDVIVHGLIGEVMAWAARTSPTGAPFVKYDVIDMQSELRLEVGIAVPDGVPGDDRMRAGTLPAGRYLTATHTGPYDQLEQATAEFLDWASRAGLAFDMEPADAGDRWGARLEYYLTDPAAEPDPQAWQTELCFRLRP